MSQSCYVPDTEHLGKSQLFYNQAILPHLLSSLDDSPEVVMVRKQCSPETLFLDTHHPPLPPALAPGAQPELGLRAPPSQQE